MVIVPKSWTVGMKSQDVKPVVPVEHIIAFVSWHGSASGSFIHAFIHSDTRSYSGP